MLIVQYIIEKPTLKHSLKVKVDSTILKHYCNEKLEPSERSHIAIEVLDKSLVLDSIIISLR